ncbi:MAG: TlpA family protein disulfide reductase [Blastocatellia bacterium]
MKARVDGMGKGWRDGILAEVLAVLFLVASPLAAWAQQTPDLPKGDGTGDVPDMFIRLVPPVAAPVASTRTSMKAPEEVRLSSLRGKVVILDIFSSRCPHCIDHAPHMAEIYTRYRQRGLTVLGLATDNPDRAVDVQSFMTSTKVNYPVGFLTSEVIAYFMDSRNHGVPQMILFGPDGKMIKRLVGWTEKTGEELRAAIEPLLPKAAATGRQAGNR